MNLPFLQLPVNNHNDEPGTHALITVHEPHHDSVDGSEFLDDAIRMKEQPLIIYAEENSIY